MKKFMCVIFCISFFVSFAFCSYVMVKNNNIVTKSSQRQEQLEKRVYKQRMECLENLMQLSKENTENLVSLLLKYDMWENADDMVYAYSKLEEFAKHKENIDYDVLMEFKRRDIYCWQKLYVSEYLIKDDPNWERLKNEHEMLMKQYDAYISVIKKI